MASPDENGEVDPLMQPRLVRALKKRPRLIDYGWREEVLEEAEEQIKQRRHPDAAAERVVQETIEAARGTGEPVIRNRMRKRVRKVNETILERL